MEIFDGNVAHISTWLYQAEALLDEIEKKPASKQEEIVQVANTGSVVLLGMEGVAVAFSLVGCAKLLAPTFFPCSRFISVYFIGDTEVLNES